MNLDTHYPCGTLLLPRLRGRRALQLGPGRSAADLESTGDPIVNFPSTLHSDPAADTDKTPTVPSVLIDSPGPRCCHCPECRRGHGIAVPPRAGLRQQPDPSTPTAPAADA